jgi:hypothetical protein
VGQISPGGKSEGGESSGSSHMDVDVDGHSKSTSGDENMEVE